MTAGPHPTCADCIALAVRVDALESRATLTDVMLARLMGAATHQGLVIEAVDKKLTAIAEALGVGNG